MQLLIVRLAPPSISDGPSDNYKYRTSPIEHYDSHSYLTSSFIFQKYQSHFYIQNEFIRANSSLHWMR